MIFAGEFGNQTAYNDYEHEAYVKGIRGSDDHEERKEDMWDCGKLRNDDVIYQGSQKESTGGEGVNWKILSSKAREVHERR